MLLRSHVCRRLQRAALVPRRFLRVLGIETSCDDTSASIVDDTGRILSLVTRHQTKDHEKTGGIVPSAAAIAHAAALPGVIRACLDQAGVRVEDLDAIAATRGPGLAPCLGVGLTAGKNIAAAINKPLVGVHHMEAHALTPRLSEQQATRPAFPYLSLLVSGGHTQLILTNGLSRHEILGSTLDDAAGEAFDKVTRYLGLPWLATGGGAGAALEQYASKVAAERGTADFDRKRWPTFTVPLRDGKNRPGRTFAFSFSGLKTSVRYCIEQHVRQTSQTIDAVDEVWKCHVAAAFQEAVTAHLSDRLTYALRHLVDERRVPLTSVVVAGGVACNKSIRSSLQAVSERFGLPFVVPPVSLCTDNAAMIAWTGLERLQVGLTDEYSIDYVPRWPLDQM
ncbi:Mitochondrial tRNAs modification protein [Sorochytrium milnesiophthora]